MPGALAEVSAARHVAPGAAAFSFRKIMPVWLWIVFAGGLVWGGLTANPFLTIFAVALLPVLRVLLWRSGEPPALLFACVMQWVQASAAIFYTNFYNASLTQTFGGPELERATWLSIIGVLVLAIGMRLALLRAPAPDEPRMIAEGRALDIRLLFAAYLASFVFFVVMSELAFRVPALTQPLLAFRVVKWVFVFVLAYAVLDQRSHYSLLLIAVGLEFASGLLGFFATFKDVFFLLLVVALTSSRAFRGRRLVLNVSISVVMVVSGILWTAIKSDYRDFLNQGFRSQEVLVPITERAGKLEDLITAFSVEQLEEALEATILRVSYVKYFALTIINVPDTVPYEHGALWGGALKHVFTPRILFPEKGAISDSERTSLYTGTQVAGEEQGTSIGIGYMGESYIDFGPVFMFAPILLLGVFFGLIYRGFVIRARHKLLGSAIASSILVFGAYTIETSNIKIIGGNVVVLLALGFLYLAFGRTATRLLQKNQTPRGAMATR